MQLTTQFLKIYSLSSFKYPVITVRDRVLITDIPPSHTKVKIKQQFINKTCTSYIQHTMQYIHDNSNIGCVMKENPKSVRDRFKDTREKKYQYKEIYILYNLH